MEGKIELIDLEYTPDSYKVIHLAPYITKTEEKLLISSKCGYIDYPIGDELKDNLVVVEKMANELSKHIQGKVNLWCTGSSGAILAAFLVTFLPKDLDITISHVKKQGETSHSGSTTWSSGGINVVVDDFICSGKTIKRITDYLLARELSLDVLCVSGDVSLYIHAIKYLVDLFPVAIANDFSRD